jgi:hypothetical protein
VEVPPHLRAAHPGQRVTVERSALLLLLLLLLRVVVLLLGWAPQCLQQERERSVKDEWLM